jgi:hypothetical protein
LHSGCTILPSLEQWVRVLEPSSILGIMSLQVLALLGNYRQYQVAHC